MSGRPGAEQVQNLSPEEVKAGIEAGEILLVDVREPDEIMAERIPGGVDAPLKSFDLSAIPDPGDKKVVFYCRSGNRSVTASLIAQSVGLPYDAHLAGGIKAWKAAGFDTERIILRR
jgi:rhodanese-related sulfurtransferase